MTNPQNNGAAPSETRSLVERLRPSNHWGERLEVVMVRWSLLDEAADALERAEAERDALRETLQRISKRGCGVPGHAVARGCSANYVAAKALEGQYVAWCPDCGGRGYQLDFEKYGRQVPCEQCRGVGFIPAALASSDTPTGGES